MQPTVAFMTQIRAGKIPQHMLVLTLLTKVVVFVRQMVDGLNEGQLWLADGSRLADGTSRPGAVIDVIYPELLSLDPLQEGDTGDPTEINVFPTRRSTMAARINNATGRMSAMLRTDPLLFARADVYLTFPGLARTDWWGRFTGGEVVRVTLTHRDLTLALRSA